jgi:hypothetical protein
VIEDIVFIFKLSDMKSVKVFGEAL